MNEEKYILFDKYLNNELNSSEVDDLETKLKTDSELANSFEIFKDMNLHLSNKFHKPSNLIQFKYNLNNANKLIKPKIFSIKPIYYAVAACFALIIGLTIFNNSGVASYQDYNQHQTAHLTERGEIIKNIKLAQDAFNKKDYKNAIINFEIVLKSYPLPEVKYFYAISLLEENRFKDAENVFHELILKNTIYKNTATWYLALSKLKQGKPENCKDILLTIPADYEDYDRVTELLNKI